MSHLIFEYVPEALNQSIIVTEVFQGYENTELTFLEELKLADSICKFIASQKKYQKFMVDNFDQLKLIFSDETFVSDLAEKFKKFNMINKFIDTYYECSENKYLKLRHNIEK